MFVLVGDIGGTNTRLALFRDREKAFERTYPSQEQSGLDVAVEHFLAEARKSVSPDISPQRACFGVAGPVENDTSQITNLPWYIDARSLETRLKIPRVALLNDFQAAALGVTVLEDKHLVPLGGGPRVGPDRCGAGAPE